MRGVGRNCRWGRGIRERDEEDGVIVELIRLLFCITLSSIAFYWDEMRRQSDQKLE